MTIPRDPLAYQVRRRRRVAEPSVPPHPLDSPELRLVMADINEALTGQAGHYDTVLERELARLAGRVGAAERYLPKDADPELRRVFGREGPVPSILGEWAVDGSYVPGLAGLSEQECRVYDLHLSGFQAAEIARQMDRKRASKFGPATLSVKRVENLLLEAQQKLRRLFGASDSDGV